MIWSSPRHYGVVGSTISRLSPRNQLHLVLIENILSSSAVASMYGAAGD